MMASSYLNVRYQDYSLSEPDSSSMIGTLVFVSSIASIPRHPGYGSARLLLPWGAVSRDPCDDQTTRCMSTALWGIFLNWLATFVI